MGRFDRLPGIDGENTTRRNALVGGFYAFFGIGIVGSALGVGEEDDQNGTDSDEDDETTGPTPTPTPTPTARERLAQEIADADYDLPAANIDTVDSVERTELVDREGYTVEVEVLADGFFDETDIVKTGLSNAYRISRVIYTSHDDVVEVWSRTLGTFLDPQGNESTETAVEVAIHEETATEIDWDGLKTLVGADPTNLLATTDSYKIHLAVCQNTDIVRECAG
jgi:hypothetical protein